MQTGGDAGQASGFAVTGFGFLSRFIATLASLVFVFLVLVTVIDPDGHFGGSVFFHIRVAARQDKVRLFVPFHPQGEVTGLILGSSTLISHQHLKPEQPGHFFKGKSECLLPD